MSSREVIIHDTSEHQFQEDVPVETFNLDSLAVLDGAGKGDWMW